MNAVIHKSRNSLFWRIDEVLQDCRAKPGWKDFHRQCGEQGLYFDDIEKVGRSKKYTAVAFTLKSGDRFVRHLVASGQGKGPIAAVVDTFDVAVEAGFPVVPELRDFLIEIQEIEQPPVVIAAAIEDILGGNSTPLDPMEML